MTTYPTRNDRPLVTFAIVAYNQEQYIAQTIASAFAQTYSPLEIIISDDVSPDGTWAIIQQEAARYSGPHQVRIRQGPRNVGLFRHVQNIAEESHGELFVISAGDDISLPQRTSEMVAAWRTSGAPALCSAFDTISETGEPLERGVFPLAPGNIVWQYFTDKRDRAFLGGNTAAYDRRFLLALPKTELRIFHEDSLLTFILYAMGHGVETIHSSLINYRIHSNSYSHLKIEGGSAADFAARERSASAYARAGHAYLSYLIDSFLPAAIAADPAMMERIDLDFMKARRRKLGLEAGWTEASVTKRLALLAKCRTPAELKIILPRLVGLPLFAQLKYLLARARVPAWSTID